VGIATVLLGRVWIEENEGPGIGRDIDVLGSVLITASLIVGAYAIVTASSHGWGSAHTLGFAAASLVLLAAFVALEARLRNPIMPLRVFAVPGLPSSSAIRGLLITGMFATFFIRRALSGAHPRLRRAHHRPGLPAPDPPTRRAVAGADRVAGDALRAPPAAAGRPVLRHRGTGAALDGRRRHGVRAGARRLVSAHRHRRRDVLPAAADHRHGRGAGGRRRAGQRDRQHLAAGLGGDRVAVLGTISTDHTRTLLAHGAGLDHAVLAGYQLAFRIGAGCVVVALVAALLWVRAPRRAREVAEPVVGAETASSSS
jgi:hypothetical protein